MLSLSHRGLVFRTKMMTPEAAFRFATCLAANPRFEGVAAVRSEKAKGERNTFVQFIPANEERRAEMAAEVQSQREVRAYQEGSEYVWVPDQSPNRRFLWLLSASGEVYEVDAAGRSCSCPDHTYRCAPAGLKCKHLLALAAGLGTVARFEPPTPAAPAGQPVEVTAAEAIAA